ncbi:MAG: hypothetical protein ACXWPS_17340 [Ktedonobacteraceae bacterium]
MEQSKRPVSPLISSGKPIWFYLVVEPFTWLFYCFFQPNRFKNEIEIQNFWKRIVPMLQLALPLFLISYPLALLVQVLILSSAPSFWTNLQSLDLSSLLSFLASLLLATAWATVIGIGLGIVGGSVGNMSLEIILGLSLSIVGIASNTGFGIIEGITVALVLGVIAGTTRGRNWGMRGGILACLVGGTAWSGAWLITESGKGAIGGGVEVAVVFLASYMFGYYRLLLYPVSGLSAAKAYFSSLKNPSQVIFYLHHSSLYWDECVFLPLPGLKRTLLLTAGLDVKLTLEEIAFIIAERPQQIGTAQEVWVEIALHNLEMCESIRDIARASQLLADILPQEASLIDLRWMIPFAHLDDTSRDAARYCGPLGWKARHTALEDMIVNLERVYPNTAFTDTRLNKRLSDVVTTWKATIQYELEKLEQASDKTGQIDNPFNPGQVLKPRDSLFVGRRDLVQQLSEALSMGGYRPTFLLNGERRMGKSSTLKQLPNLLGAHYLPIVYDLQVRGVSASTDAFLNTLAGEIYKIMSGRGMKVKKLEQVQLKAANRRNEAEVYRLFDAWLNDQEKLLQREDRTLLLLIDEFEKLEEAAHDGYLNLHLLLDWFRSTIQNRSRVAFLFSGVRTFGEMGGNWAGYFVNVQTLKVTFLRPAEAYHLITQPVPHFPGQRIFGDEVIERIIHLTGCHPFFIQAMCSALIENLNVDDRQHAEPGDVALAMDQVLENWWDTYFRDLWERTDQYQRACLVTLRHIGDSDPQKIAQENNLDEKIVRRTLQTLFKRDLVLLENDLYRIATPIFEQWIDRIS